MIIVADAEAAEVFVIAAALAGAVDAGDTGDAADTEDAADAEDAAFVVVQ